MNTATSKAASQNNAPPGDNALADDERSKDAFFVRVGEVVDEMIERHGRDFATGTLILAARFVAEGRNLGKAKENEKVHTN